MPRMSEPSIDLDAYFRRIGYTGPREPTLATLNGLILRHVQTIPFENLDVLLGRGISLDPAAIERKLIHERRGGYCFEQNGLFQLVLQALGFDVTPISARARWQRPRDFTPPRTHLFSRVEIDGASWLADVGVGGMSPSYALRLELDTEQPTPHEPRRLIKEGAIYYHQVRLGGEWQDICEFTLETMPMIDREVANWFTSTHPKSHFKSNILVARAGPDGGRVTLLDNRLILRDGRGQANIRLLTSKQELLAVLAEHFGVQLPADAQFHLPGAAWLL
ncbi:Arylamine N-acetyltransferase [Chthoniobacter flavus Ellin428]|uniref:Arylamine N-acetyltransferase n=2 Tax=Chthoniobacter flavus TaxID=191863 RepID=B4D2S3_9BACT|nr:Arylamine N-acetyltransferase [Chthoniobacter flavus Ellin428]TCO86797.1 N-hydroxyarylamine O-acetyltransferase [Chthoniobacter flavus]